MLVARRVKKWVDPLLYRILVLGQKFPSNFPICPVDIILRAIQAKPPGFFEAAVRHLMVGANLNTDDIVAILSVSPGCRISGYRVSQIFGFRSSGLFPWNASVPTVTL
ncbi:hypothetical protein B0H19DRAFT_1103994 [Mycena capillaripes]|nr:hypothetical protein B0H19DRAFT_1103994 [Mycena capillaripes]